MGWFTRVAITGLMLVPLVYCILNDMWVETCALTLGMLLMGRLLAMGSRNNL